MDGERTNDHTVVGEDATTEFSTIPLMMEFREPETVNPVTVNQEPVEMAPEPQQEPIAELTVPPAVNTAVTTVTAIRLGSGADDTPTTTESADVEDENTDRRARRTRSRGRRSRRSRRGRRSRSRSRRSRRSRSRSDDGDFYVQIADDEISAELAAGSSRGGGQKTARGGRRAKKLAITGRRGGKATHESRVSGKASRGTRGGRKSARGSRRGRKTTECVTARTMWYERLRPLSLNRNKK
ncbi:unnamed protein product [Macrosiphum euphorbiae]|uniref:Uncharacterized protein n=1 Tax=Macrosiphum euphorbiae TaxID=13131 RepID=A0AAV0WQH5_9HEMI|nr:unnamed protein product [Macrosiphum euphorbiae]